MVNIKYYKFHMKQALAANNLPSSLQILIVREEALVL